MRVLSLLRRRGGRGGEAQPPPPPSRNGTRETPLVLGALLRLPSRARAPAKRVRPRSSWRRCRGVDRRAGARANDLRFPLCPLSPLEIRRGVPPRDARRRRRLSPQTTHHPPTPPKNNRQTDGWDKRWLKSTWKAKSKEAGEWLHTAGKWFGGDEGAAKGLQTSPDSKYHAISAEIKKAVDNTGKELVLQVRGRGDEGGGLFGLFVVGRAGGKGFFGRAPIAGRRSSALRALSSVASLL